MTMLFRLGLDILISLDASNGELRIKLIHPLRDVHMLCCVEIKTKESEVDILKSTSGNKMEKYISFNYSYVPVTSTVGYFRILVISDSCTSQCFFYLRTMIANSPITFKCLHIPVINIFWLLIQSGNL